MYRVIKQALSRKSALLPGTLVLVSVCALGCAATDVELRYPSPTEAKTGRVTIELSRPVGAVKVTVNEAIVASGDYTERIVITRVPAGEAHIVVAGGTDDTEALYESFDLEVLPGGEHTVIAAAPPLTDGTWTYLGLEYVGVAIMYGALVLAFF